ncbi:MAG: 2-amino-4-hydroxy-6-hydroxymethyldihydropteridine diphosphokinase [Sedimentisphaerales bacterium]
MLPKPSETSNIDSEAFIAVGSNIEPHQNVSQALRILSKYVTICSISNFYRSQATERAEQNDFINGVVKILTTHQPRELKFDVLREIESQLGRIRTDDKHAARTIDLDLILYDDVTTNEADLILPDPSINIYPFVAVPLLELLPDLILPGTRVRLDTVRAALETNTLHPQDKLTDQLRSQFLNK